MRDHPPARDTDAARFGGFFLAASGPPPRGGRALI